MLTSEIKVVTFSNLQYKMFLLNFSTSFLSLTLFLFTIQNVSIKLLSRFVL